MRSQKDTKEPIDEGAARAHQACKLRGVLCCALLGMAALPAPPAPRLRRGRILRGVRRCACVGMELRRVKREKERQQRPIEARQDVRADLHANLSDGGLAPLRCEWHASSG